MDAFVLQHLIPLLPQLAEMTKIRALQRQLLFSIINLAMPALQSLKTVDAILQEVCSVSSVTHMILCTACCTVLYASAHLIMLCKQTALMSANANLQSKACHSQLLCAWHANHEGFTQAWSGLAMSVLAKTTPC